MRTVFLTTAALLLTGLVTGQTRRMIIGENTREQDSIAATGRCVFISKNEIYPNMIYFKFLEDEGEYEGVDVTHIYGSTQNIEKHISVILSNFDKSLKAPDSVGFDDGVFLKYWKLDRAEDSFYSLLELAVDIYGTATVTSMIYEKEEE